MVLRSKAAGVGAGMGGVGNDRRSCVAAALLCSASPLPAMAQATLNDALAAKTQRGRRHGAGSWSRRGRSSTTTTTTRVSAVGDVELNYQGRTLQADRVIYDRKTGRVYRGGQRPHDRGRTAR